MADFELCSKCRLNPRADAESSNPWCKPCRAKYAKEYAQTKMMMERAKAFAAGAEAAMQMLAHEFGRHGRVLITAGEIAQAIQASPRPQYQAEKS